MITAWLPAGQRSPVRTGVSLGCARVYLECARTLTLLGDVLGALREPSERLDPFHVMRGREQRERDVRLYLSDLAQLLDCRRS